MLSVEEEAIVIAFRRHTLLPLDHCSLFASNDLPHLTRSWTSPAPLPSAA